MVAIERNQFELRTDVITVETEEILFTKPRRGDIMVEPEMMLLEPRRGGIMGDPRSFS